MATYGSKVRKAKSRLAKEKSDARAAVNKQQSYINQYWQFESGNPKFKNRHTRPENIFYNGSWTTGGGIKETHLWRGNGLGMGAVDPNYFSYMSPDVAHNIHTNQKKHYKKPSKLQKTKKTYAKLASDLRPKALLAALGGKQKAYDTWDLVKNKKVGYVKPPKRTGRKTAVLLDNQKQEKLIGGVIYTQEERGINTFSNGMVMPNTSDDSGGFIEHLVEKPYSSTGDESLISQIGSGDPNAIGTTADPVYEMMDNTSYFDNYANIIPSKPKETDIFIDEGRHDYLMDILSDGDNSNTNKQNIMNVYGFNDKIKDNYDGMTDSQKMLYDKKHNAKLIKQLNAEKDASGADIKYLSSAIKKLNVKGISSSEYAKIKDGLTKKYPNILLSGSYANDIATIEKIKMNEMSRNVELKKNQADMNMYIAQERANTIKQRQGAVVTMKNTADIRAASLKAKEQKVSDNASWAQQQRMWEAIMTDPNIVKVGNKYVRIEPKKTTDKSLEEKVEIIKAYDSWDQRRDHIGSELDARKEELFTMYSNKYNFDLSVSDKEASQHLLGMDAPEGHSLAITAFAETTIDNKTPRKLIASLNTVIDKTNKDKKIYTEGISEVDKELLSLKEKRILQKAKNKSIRDNLRQQIEADVSGGNVRANTEIQDNIQASQDDLARLNLGIAERNVKKDYWEKSIAKTDDDLADLDVTMKKAIKAKRRKDYNALTAVYSTGLPSKTRGPLYGYYNRRSTGIQKKRIRGGYTAGLGGLVL
jgi:hypothetical protein